MQWDKYANAGTRWWKPENPGDEIVGTIRIVRDGTDYNKNPVPELVLDDPAGGSVIVTASQVMLKRALIEAAPQEGQRVRIIYTGNGEAREGRQAPKLFTVDVKPGEAPTDEPAIF
jgi:hypothetical protein